MLFSCVLSENFSIGENNAKEAANSGVHYAAGGSFANRLQRETAVGPADPALKCS